MAGDWIKVEIVTPDKPEVHAIAARLGVTPEDAFGRLFRVWAWLDSVSRNGHARVTHLSTIDAIARRDGFGQAMSEVGWLDARDGGIYAPNFDRHNGKSAKNRALARDRKVTQRSRDGHDESVTREEKRRVSPSLRSGESARGTRLSPDWRLSTEQIEWALKAQPTWDAEYALKVGESFRDHWKAAPGQRGVKLDWDATWRNWVRREGERRVGAGKGSVDAWWVSDAGITRKGAEIGMAAKAGETMASYRDRIKQRIEDGKRAA